MSDIQDEAYTELCEENAKGGRVRRRVRRRALSEHPDQQFLVCMGFDAMRIALGRKPCNYSIQEVVTWIECIGQELRKAAE